MNYNNKSQSKAQNNNLKTIPDIDKNVTICVSSVSSLNNNKLTCQYCNKTLSSRQSRWRHYKTCNKKNTIENKLLTLENKLSEFEKANVYVETLLDNHIKLLNEHNLNSNMIKIIKKNYKLIYKNTNLTATTKTKVKANIKILKKLSKIEHFNKSNTLDKILIKKLSLINNTNTNKDTNNDSVKTNTNTDNNSVKTNTNIDIKINSNNNSDNDSDNDKKPQRPIYQLYNDSSTASTSDYDSLT